MKENTTNTQDFEKSEELPFDPETGEVNETAEPTTAVALVADDQGGFGDLSSFDFSDDQVTSLPSYSCLPMETDEERLAAFNSLNNPKKKSKQMINKRFMLVGFAFEGIMLPNEKTGEGEMCPRVVMVDDKGDSCQFVSFGILSALKKLKQTFGIERIKKGVELEFRQEETKRGSMLTFDVVGFKK